MMGRFGGSEIPMMSFSTRRFSSSSRPHDQPRRLENEIAFQAAVHGHIEVGIAHVPPAASPFGKLNQPSLQFCVFDGWPLFLRATTRGELSATPYPANSKGGFFHSL